MSNDLSPEELTALPWCDESNGVPVIRGDSHIATFSHSKDANEYILQARRIAELQSALVSLKLAVVGHENTRHVHEPRTATETSDARVLQLEAALRHIAQGGNTIPAGTSYVAHLEEVSRCALNNRPSLPPTDDPYLREVLTTVRAEIINNVPLKTEYQDWAATIERIDLALGVSHEPETTQRKACSMYIPFRLGETHKCANCGCSAAAHETGGSRGAE